MKTKKKESDKIEFTRGNSNTPLPGVSSSNIHAIKDKKKGTNKDTLDLERRREADERELKKLKKRENKLNYNSI